MHAQSAPTAGKALVGVGVLLGGLVLIFQEIDTALEVAGIFAAGQFALRKLLFAEDRQATQKQLKCARSLRAATLSPSHSMHRPAHRQVAPRLARGAQCSPCPQGCLVFGRVTVKTGS